MFLWKIVENNCRQNSILVTGNYKQVFIIYSDCFVFINYWSICVKIINGIHCALFLLNLNIYYNL